MLLVDEIVGKRSVSKSLRRNFVMSMFSVAAFLLPFHLLLLTIASADTFAPNKVQTSELRL